MNLTAKSIISLIITILIIVGLGSFIGYSSGSGASSDWYQNINKSDLNPPGFVFGIVWPILYALMGFALWRVRQFEASGDKRKALTLFALQIALNFAWSYIFFMFEMPLLSFVWILGLIVIVALWVRSLYKLDPLTAYTQIPYLAWLCFASYLSGSIVFLN